MSESNIDLVRNGYEALATGGLEALLPLIDPEFEATTPADLASEPDTYRGQDGLRRYFDSFEEVMEDIRFEPHDFVAAGELVVVPFTVHARGRATGMEFGQPAVHVWELRGEKAIRLEVFADTDQAMAYAREREGGT